MNPGRFCWEWKASVQSDYLKIEHGKANLQIKITKKFISSITISFTEIHIIIAKISEG
jgi:hypothetical protein